MYEHPYSKFINHTTWYLVFLGFIILTSYEHEFGTTVTGMVWIGRSCDCCLFFFCLFHSVEKIPEVNVHVYFPFTSVFKR